MLVAISQDMKKGKWRDSDSLEREYSAFFKKFGVNLIQIPNNSKVEEYFKDDLIKGVVLSGGTDVGKLEERDQTEKKLIEIGLERRLPILGICRGMQFIQNYFGGKLTAVRNHVGESHSIELFERNGIKYPFNNVDVNSYHNIGFTEGELAKELEMFAISKDGLVEGIFHPKYPIVGIQWHPERGEITEINKLLINAFLERRMYWK